VSAVERTTVVCHPDLPDLDAALSWVVQTVEREGFTSPKVQIRPISRCPVDGDEWTESCEVSVSQHVTETVEQARP
jgi:hypothetical protein